MELEGIYSLIYIYIRRTLSRLVSYFCHFQPSRARKIPFHIHMGLCRDIKQCLRERLDFLERERKQKSSFSPFLMDSVHKVGNRFATGKRHKREKQLLLYYTLAVVIERRRIGKDSLAHSTLAPNDSLLGVCIDTNVIKRL